MPEKTSFCQSKKSIKALASPCRGTFFRSWRFLACPDFKGIKTRAASRAPSSVRFLACPDFKGIKTLCFHSLRSFCCFWPALISKGLRRNFLVCKSPINRFWPALISKGLRLNFMSRPAEALPRFWPALISKGLRLTVRFFVARYGFEFLACPDFKGIKTGGVGGGSPTPAVSGLP